MGNFKSNRNTIIYIIKYLGILILVLILGTLYSCQRDNKSGGTMLEIAGDTNDFMNEESESDYRFEGDVYDKGESKNSNEFYDSNYICVHIVGYVTNPGVYYVAQGARINEVIKLAGGFLTEADESYLNLASVVSDGQKIQVLSKEEAKTAKPFVSQSDMETVKNLVNINTATKGELMQLAGIGESRALSIIAYREKHGDFKEISDIMKISGIKEAAYEKIKDYICVD